MMSETTTGHTPTDEDVDTFVWQWRDWRNGLWRVVNDSGYVSVSMVREVAERDAARWGDNVGAPYQAEPCPKPTIGPIVERERRAAKVEARDDLIERLEKAIDTLNSMAFDAAQESGQFARRVVALDGKTDGVELALSYVREIERGS